VAGVVSQPDRPRGRGRRSTASPVAARALAAGVPVLRPEDVNSAETLSELRGLAPDLGVVVAFGQFIGRRVRELPRLGYCVNGHASLLPRWRGAAPVARAILAGDRVTGISIMRLVREMDAGPVALRRELAIGPDEDAGSLGERLAALCAPCTREVLAGIEAGGVVWREQDPAGVTLAPRLEREEARLDWSDAAEALGRRVRAFGPRPGAFTTLDGEPLRILAARVEPGPVEAEPGTLCGAGRGAVRIATGDGWLVPLRLQRAGGRVLDVDEFLRGRPLADGTRLGPPRATPSATLRP
jgi:methionyl-tRNA formyltransferase